MTRLPRRLAATLVLLGAGALAAPAAANHGALDPLFGTEQPASGFALADLTPGDDALDDVVGLPDGRIAAVGRAGGFAVTRFTAAGRLDTSFSGDGLRVIGAAGGRAHAVGTGFRLPVVAAGTAPLPTQAGDVALIRAFDESGANLASFGEASSIIINRGPDVDTAARALAVDAPPPPAPNRPARQPLIAVGGASGAAGGPTDAWLAVMTPQGVLSSPGVVTLPHFAGPSSADTVNDVVFTPDRAVVAVGASRLGVGNGVAFVHKRTPQGAPDTTFGGDGTVTGQFGCDGPLGAEAHAVVLEPQGGVVVAGVCGGTAATMFVARLNADGTPDPRFRLFNANNPFPRAAEPVRDIVRRSDGTFVVVGSSGAGDARRTMAIGLAPNGDVLRQGTSEFGVNGFQIAGPRAGGPSELSAVATTSDGNLVAAGLGGPQAGALLLVRYHAARDRARPAGVLRALGTGLAGVRLRGALRVRLSASEPVAVSLRARPAGGGAVVARADLPIARPRARTLRVPLTARGRTLLAGAATARLRVTAVITDVVGKERTIATTVRLG